MARANLGERPAQRLNNLLTAVQHPDDQCASGLPHHHLHQLPLQRKQHARQLMPALASNSTLLEMAAWLLLKIIGRITHAQQTVMSVGVTFA